MRFENAAQEECHRRAGEDLRAAFADRVRPAPGLPAWFVALGRVGVRVEVGAVGDDEAVVDVYAWIAQGATITPELGLFLARRAAGLAFAALVVDAQDAVLVQQSLFSEGTNAIVLPRLVAYVAETADELDEELRARFAAAFPG